MSSSDSIPVSILNVSWYNGPHPFFLSSKFFSICDFALKKCGQSVSTASKISFLEKYAVLRLQTQDLCKEYFSGGIWPTFWYFWRQNNWKKSGMLAKKLLGIMCTETNKYLELWYMAVHGFNNIWTKTYSKRLCQPTKDPERWTQALVFRVLSKPLPTSLCWQLTAYHWELSGISLIHFDLLHIPNFLHLVSSFHSLDNFSPFLSNGLFPIWQLSGDVMGKMGMTLLFTSSKNIICS